MASALNVSSKEPMSFEEYWNKWKKQDDPYYYLNGDKGGRNDNPNSLWNKINNFFTGKVTSAKQSYENYLSNFEFQRNQEAAAQANAATWQREDTAVQRQKADMEAAGFNPYMLYAGSVSSAASTQAQVPEYKRSGKLSEKDESKLAGTALKLLALIVLKKMI